MNWPGAVLICLAFGCQTPVVEGIDQTQSELWVQELERHQIPASSVRQPGGKFTIEVASSDVAPSVAVLTASTQPPPASSALREGLIPDPRADRLRIRQAVIEEVTTTLRGLDGVVQARVHVAEPTPARFALPETATAWSATTVVTHRGERPAEEPIRQITAAAFSELQPSDVTVEYSRASPPRVPTVPLVHIGPVAVARSSATTIKSIAIGSLLLHILLAGGLIWTRRRTTAHKERT